MSADEEPKPEADNNLWSLVVFEKEPIPRAVRDTYIFANKSSATMGKFPSRAYWPNYESILKVISVMEKNPEPETEKWLTLPCNVLISGRAKDYIIQKAKKVRDKLAQRREADSKSEDSLHQSDYASTDVDGKRRSRPPAAFSPFNEGREKKMNLPQGGGSVAKKKKKGLPTPEKPFVRVKLPEEPPKLSLKKSSVNKKKDFGMIASPARSLGDASVSGNASPVPAMRSPREQERHVFSPLKTATSFGRGSSLKSPKKAGMSPPKSLKSAAGKVARNLNDTLQKASKEGLKPSTAKILPVTHALSTSASSSNEWTKPLSPRTRKALAGAKVSDAGSEGTNKLGPQSEVWRGLHLPLPTIDFQKYVIVAQSENKLLLNQILKAATSGNNAQPDEGSKSKERIASSRFHQVNLDIPDMNFESDSGIRQYFRKLKSDEKAVANLRKFVATAAKRYRPPSTQVETEKSSLLKILKNSLLPWIFTPQALSSTKCSYMKQFPGAEIFFDAIRDALNDAKYEVDTKYVEHLCGVCFRRVKSEYNAAKAKAEKSIEALKSGPKDEDSVKNSPHRSNADFSGDAKKQTKSGGVNSKHHSSGKAGSTIRSSKKSTSPSQKRNKRFNQTRPDDSASSCSGDDEEHPHASRLSLQRSAKADGKAKSKCSETGSSSERSRDSPSPRKRKRMVVKSTDNSEEEDVCSPSPSKRNKRGSSSDDSSDNDIMIKVKKILK